MAAGRDIVTRLGGADAVDADVVEMKSHLGAILLKLGDVRKRRSNLERENTELKKIVAEQALDIRMLRDVNSKKW